MAILKRRKNSEEARAKTSQEQQYKPEAVTSVDESTNINLGQTTTGTTDTNAGNAAQSANTANTSGAAGSADYNAHPYYNEGGTATSSVATGGTNLATNTSGDATITDAVEVTPTSTTEEVKEETPTETVTETETEKEPESTPEPTTEPEAEPEPAPAPADNGMPQRGTRFEDEARANAPKEHTPEELEDAKKRGKRESRMATAGHIMDTLARVLNFAATTQGAPSAKWSNRNREFDKNTYYDRMKKENEEARKNYFNMMLAGAGQDTKDYATALSGWREGNKEKREAELQPYKIAESQGKARKSEAEAAIKEIEAKYAPDQQQAKLEALQAQARKYAQQGKQAEAAAVASYAMAQKHRADMARNEYHFMGETYYNQKDWEKAIDKYYEQLPEDDELRNQIYEDDTSETEKGKVRANGEYVPREKTITSKKKLKDYSTRAGMAEAQEGNGF